MTVYDLKDRIVLAFIADKLPAFKFVPFKLPPSPSRLVLKMSGAKDKPIGETKASVVANGAPTVAWNGVNKETLTGWTIGAGAEFQINDGIILRTEYLYTDLGDSKVTAAGNSTVRGIATLNGIDYVARTDYRGGEVRAGLLVGS